MAKKYGRITTKDGKNTLTGEYYEFPFSFYFYTDGQTKVAYFMKSEWDFEEIKPTPYEVIKAMKPGTVFRQAGKPGALPFIRLTGDMYWSTLGNKAYPLTADEFRLDVEEVDE